MNILYLHGLDSSLNNDKRKILEKYGEVYAPQIDYRADSNSIATLLSKIENMVINTIIGSTMGGFAGYYIADALQIPALLFNPALAYRSVPQEIPSIKNSHSNFKHIVLGAKDETIDPKSTLAFLSKSIGIDNYNINIRQDLAHRIPANIFKEEVKAFFKEYHSL
ncbi:YqiA/YcfP family alpha/beta fold hydrolase [Aequorivita marina]|uniref:YqiA/YcfP family alpha/beta fold hydrolase n=1 Tax=Aequorivita marina TaxID=3073654 RepID=UPI0028757104|nr:YqiA/YcfP family alpha/beta fold hydrolase [Aequorivita sp. S2608]MDS1297329.1 YqiA/YcfP family alpha/beta fold hydrolase [Aequorivita sp. S2608]